jgi:hypothetical protein
MPETRHTRHSHRSHQSHRHNSRHHSGRGYLEPVYYFAGMILLLILVKLLHASLLPTTIGALGIILLAISKLWKFRAGAIIAVACQLAMAMIFNWAWADYYFISILSAEQVSRPFLFTNGLLDTLIPIILIWTFHKQLNDIHIRSSQKWFVKKSYVTFFKLLLYFQAFLLLFWIFAMMLLSAHPLTGFVPQDSAMIAGALALLATGIPAIIYITKGAPSGRRRHVHRRHRIHGGEAPGKNTETV